MKDHTDAALMHLKKAFQDKIAAAVLAANSECSDMTIRRSLKQPVDSKV